MAWTPKRSATLEEFVKRFDEAQQPSLFYKAAWPEKQEDIWSATLAEPGPGKFNPRVIVARIVLNTESPDVAEAVCEDLVRVVRGSCGGHYSHAGWAITTLAAME